MYNRYIRDQEGVYNRIPEDEPAPSAYGPPPQKPPQPPPKDGGASQLLQRILEKLGMENVDTGDLLLLLILFLLFTEGDSRDEELMIALGLLLIL